MMTDVDVSIADWPREKDALTRIRMEVFVQEQRVPLALELDGLDPDCLHVKAVLEGALIGCARLLPDHHVGRMCVLRPWRNQGIGSAIMTFLIKHARDTRIPLLQLNAQLTAVPFYRHFGFEADGKVFLDAGIEHRKMTLIIDP